MNLYPKYILMDAKAASRLSKCSQKHHSQRVSHRLGQQLKWANPAVTPDTKSSTCKKQAFPAIWFKVFLRAGKPPVLLKGTGLKVVEKSFTCVRQVW